jgi:PAS domain S-box-containing protein
LSVLAAALLLVLLAISVIRLRQSSSARREVLAALHRREAELRDSEERLSLAITSADLGVFDHDVESGEWYCSDRWFEMMGLPRSASRDWRRVVHPGDLPGLLQAYDVRDHASDEISAAFRVVRPSGEERSLIGTAHLHRDADGRLVRVVGTLSDVSEQHHADVALRHSEVFLDSVIEHFPSMVFVKRADDLSFVRVNRAAEALFGCGRDDVIGRTDFDLFSAAAAEANVAEDRAALRSGRLLDLGTRPADVPGRGERLLHTCKILIPDEDGQPLYLLGIAEDVTEEERARLELQRAHIAAEDANRAKNDFLSRMSHELRTPLNAILGFSQLIELETTSAPHRESAVQIQRAGHHLLDLINEVLDIAQIETGRLALSLEPISISDVCYEALALVAPIAGSRYIELSTDLPRSAPEHVQADRQRLMQVLLNLLSNAVKYNRHAGQVRLTTDCGPNGRLRVSIKDTGGGVTPAQVERLFVPFERLDAARSGVEGTGLGLALSARFVQAMGGSIGVDSVPGEGSCFWFELDLVAPPDERDVSVRPLRRSAGASTRTVLYVEDNRSIMRLVERIVEHRPDVLLLQAPTGALGLELATRHRPDIIILDLHLPDLNGEVVLRRLHAEPATRDLPVVVISADATPRQINRLVAQGAAGYLTKPFDIEQFLAVIDGDLQALDAAHDRDHTAL